MQFKTLVIALIAGIAAATPVEDTEAGLEVEARGGPRGGGGRGGRGEFRGGRGEFRGGRGGYYRGGPGWGPGPYLCDPLIQFCGVW